MVSITLSVSPEIKRLMNKFPEVNWSALVRKMIEEKAKQLEVKEEFLQKIKDERVFNDWAVGVVRKGRKE